jgi:CIC family chloride channel protein
VLGVAGGAVAVLFVGFIKFARPRLRRMPQSSQYLQPAVAGLLIGFCAIRFPQVMGAGYEWVDLAMHNRFPWEVLGILAGLKLITSAVSFACGSPAGLWAPVLFSGAMLGALTATVEQQLLPSIAVPVGAYALVGMGALFAGILRAPMTSVFMVLEISGNYSIILPVLLCNTIAYMISRSFHKVPLYEMVARQDGLDLPSLEEEQEPPALCVEDAMRGAPAPPLRGEETIAMGRLAAGEGGEQQFLVSLGQGRWSLLSRDALFAAEIDEGAVLRSLARSRVPRIYLDQSLDVALRFLKDRPMLPVVDRGRLDHLLGVVSVDDILAAYRRAGLAEPENPEAAP